MPGVEDGMMEMGMGMGINCGLVRKCLHLMLILRKGEEDAMGDATGKGSK